MLEKGTRLGHYEIEALLGVGGMGEVYRARDTKLGRDVAIKVLPDDLSRDADRLARFEREAKLLAQLNHPNIATLHGLEESNGRRFLVMELVEGETLAEHIARGSLTVEEALPLFIQIAEGLEAAHEKGIVHRDLKPPNIKITPEGKVKILDFGLARASEVASEAGGVATSQSPTLTKGTALGAIMGTAAYMSPEQARGKTADKRADIWAFGCVLYEALTRTPAFSGESITDVLAAVVTSEPNWERLPHAVTWRIRDLLRRCMRKDRERRLRDISAARLDLEDALADPVAPVSRERPTPWPLIAMGAVVLGAGILVGAIGLWSLSERPREEVVRFTIELPPEQKLRTRGDIGLLAISADGRHMTYVAEAGDGKAGLYFRSIDDFESRFVPGTQGAERPFFSPDGEWVGFFAENKLQKVRWDGGLPMTLCRVMNFPGGGFWTADETIIYSATTIGLFQVSASGGEPELLTSADFARAEVTLARPQVLPGGDALLVTIHTMDGVQFGTHHLTSGERRVLGQGSNALYVSSGHIAV